MKQVSLIDQLKPYQLIIHEVWANLNDGIARKARVLTTPVKHEDGSYTYEIEWLDELK